MIRSLRAVHWTRWLRIGIALAFIAQGYVSGDGIAYAIGAVLGLQAVFNWGCASAAGCTAPSMTDPGTAPEAITKGGTT